MRRHSGSGFAAVFAIMLAILPLIRFRTIPPSGCDDEKLMGYVWWDCFASLPSFCVLEPVGCVWSSRSNGEMMRGMVLIAFISTARYVLRHCSRFDAM